MKRGIDECLRTEGGCESEEAMMKIASLLMGTTEEVPSLETKPSAKKKK